MKLVYSKSALRLPFLVCLFPAMMSKLVCTIKYRFLMKNKLWFDYLMQLSTRTLRFDPSLSQQC